MAFVHGPGMPGMEAVILGNIERFAGSNDGNSMRLRGDDQSFLRCGLRTAEVHDGEDKKKSKKYE
jgi:hypothetical protein